MNNRIKREQLGRVGFMFALVMFLTLTFVAPSVKAQTTKNSPKADSSTVVSVVIPVDGMSCPACVANVKRKLKSINGVSKVRVSLEKQNVVVRYDPKSTSLETLKKSIDDLGYRAGTPRTKGKSE